jgi:hypothetical protein
LLADVKACILPVAASCATALSEVKSQSTELGPRTAIFLVFQKRAHMYLSSSVQNTLRKMDIPFWSFRADVKDGVEADTEYKAEGMSEDNEEARTSVVAAECNLPKQIIPRTHDGDDEDDGEEPDGTMQVELFSGKVEPSGHDVKSRRKDVHTKLLSLSQPLRVVIRRVASRGSHHRGHYFAFYCECSCGKVCEVKIRRYVGLRRHIEKLRGFLID